MGSEMCIRDRVSGLAQLVRPQTKLVCLRPAFVQTVPQCMLQCSMAGLNFIIEWAPLVTSYQILCLHLHPCLKIASGNLDLALDYQILNLHCLWGNPIKLASKEIFPEQKGKRNAKAQCDLWRCFIQSMPARRLGIWASPASASTN